MILTASVPYYYIKCVGGVGARTTCPVLARPQRAQTIPSHSDSLIAENINVLKSTCGGRVMDSVRPSPSPQNSTLFTMQLAGPDPKLFSASRGPVPVCFWKLERSYCGH